MKKKIYAVLMAATMTFSCMGCAGQTTAETVQSENQAQSSTEEAKEETKEETAKETSTDTESSSEKENVLEDGTYSAKFTTDGSMFHINEVYKDRGTLTVKDGEMVIHITLPSKNIVNLFPGTAEDAQKDGAILLEPTTDQVTYEDGSKEEVNGFDVPVPVIDEEFAMAIIGTKGKWYDHMVTVSDVQPYEEDEDKMAADNVAELIDSIYVQNYTEDTYEKCESAKKAWDALTDAQKDLVEGEFADSDYFGRDTGDASNDDPLNGDDIGEKELLVVSFGTSFNKSRVEDIGGIERALAKANPEWSVRRAFTAQIIINHVYARDGEKIDNMEQALERAVNNKVKHLVVQPTHLMHGAEYDELTAALEKYKDKFETAVVAEPLLGSVGKDASVINEDKEKVAKAVTKEAVEVAGYKDLSEAKEAGVAFVFLGHGTSHSAKVTYDQMQTQMEELGYENVFIGTVEGEPEDTEVSNVIAAVKDAGYKTVVLRPLMVVAGDHANNDMAGEDEDSWKSLFEADGDFEKVECQISGLGGISDVQNIYIEHTGAVIE